MTDSLVANPDSRAITVWSDIGCPWATLALTQLRRQITDHGADLQIDHRAFPLEFFNKRPTPKPVTDSEIVAIAGLVDGLGWRPWAKPEWTFVSTTIPAMEAVQAAKHQSVGGLRASDQLDAALRRAFYHDHTCISVIPLILEVAGECAALDVDRLTWGLRAGEGRWRLYDQWEVAQTPAINCSPHVFLADGRSYINPGARYSWKGGAERGFPRLEQYSADWARDLVVSLT